MARAKIVEARKKAREILKQFDIDEAPIPIDRIAKLLGVAVHHVALDGELSGMALEKDGQAVVGVNSLHHPNRQRFTIAHELAHIVLHRAHIAAQVHVDKEFRVRSGRVLRRDTVAATGTDALEIEANAFASELLMPRQLIEQELHGDWDIDDERLSELARKFKVSTAAMQFRIMDFD